METPQTEAETTEKTRDPRLDDYTEEISKRIARAFPEFTPDQKIRALILSEDLAEEKIALEDLADTDKLTGLLNKRGFHKEADRKLQQYHRQLKEGGTIAISMLHIDLDGFKQVNEAYNHQGGDQVLSAFGSFINASIRSVDIAGRDGGEEFVILLEDISQEDAIKTAERLRTDATEAFNTLFPEWQWPKTLSIGVYQLPAMTPDQLATEEGRLNLLAQAINKADKAQSDGAKHVGKNRIGVMLPDDTVQTAVFNINDEGKTVIDYQNPVQVPASTSAHTSPS